MGVHDYRCSVCGTPGSYECGEKTGEECEQTGIGEDKAVLMDDEDATGIWLIQPYDEDDGDGSPVSIKIAEGERVWVVNYCPPCRALFAEGKKPRSEPCSEYLRSISEHLEIPLKVKKGQEREAKAPFIEKVRTRVAHRLPARK